MVMMLAKTTKSLQLMLNEAVPKLGISMSTVSNTAYSKARRKLRHTAFIELNTACVVPSMYEDGDYQTYKGLRVLGVDGSKIILPDNASTVPYFGTIENTGNASGRYCAAMASVLYDVLNGVCIDASLSHSRSYEVDLAIEHLVHTNDDDLVIYDRNYHTFKMAAQATAAKGHFLIRCSNRGWTVVTDMFEGKGNDDVICEIKPSKEAQKMGFTKPLTIRFVRVVLDTGEVEVLMTSLLDKELYPAEDFKDLYWKRWGVETFYGILKGRLDLENFSGRSASSVLQDFHASVFLTGVEAIFCEETNNELKDRNTVHDYQVNKAVSFNAIKNRIFDLLLLDKPAGKIIDELDGLFLTNPVAIRKGRNPPRSSASDRKRFLFWKRERKNTF